MEDEVPGLLLNKGFGGEGGEDARIPIVVERNPFGQVAGGMAGVTGLNPELFRNLDELIQPLI